MLASYTDEKGMAGDNVNTIKLLGTSRSVSGFFMPDYNELAPAHMAKMIKMLSEGKLKIEIDSCGLSGIESVAKGVEYLHEGKNKGKVVIPLIEKKNSKI
jgi:NADPH-dependent curcumin reductase CurA